MKKTVKNVFSKKVQHASLRQRHSFSGYGGKNYDFFFSCGIWLHCGLLRHSCLSILRSGDFQGNLGQHIDFKTLRKCNDKR